MKWPPSKPAAVARARRYVRRPQERRRVSAQPLELRDSEGAAPRPWFGRENSRAWVKAGLKAGAQGERREPPTCIFCLRARPRTAFSVADEALREIIVEHKERDENLFTSLRAYDIEITQAGRRRQGGWDTTEVVLRNLAFSVSSPTSAMRSPASDPFAGLAAPRLSGCYIAARALMEETRSRLGVGHREGLDAIQLPSRAGPLAYYCTLYSWCRAKVLRHFSQTGLIGLPGSPNRSVSPMSSRFVRFRDLKARGIANSWAQLDNLIKSTAFHQGGGSAQRPAFGTWRRRSSRGSPRGRRPARPRAAPRKVAKGRRPRSASAKPPTKPPPSPDKTAAV